MAANPPPYEDAQASSDNVGRHAQPEESNQDGSAQAKNGHKAAEYDPHAVTVRRSITSFGGDDEDEDDESEKKKVKKEQETEAAKKSETQNQDSSAEQLTEKKVKAETEAERRAARLLRAKMLAEKLQVGL
jgi:hypothetical protein